MAYFLFRTNHPYVPRKGLEGPYTYPNGRTLYYDPKAGQWWDPSTDWYLGDDEVADIQGSVFDKLMGKK